jgi:hypothetical protein
MGGDPRCEGTRTRWSFPEAAGSGTASWSAPLISGIFTPETAIHGLYGLWSRFPIKTLLLRPDPITRLSAVESVLKTYPIHQRNRPAGTPEKWLPRVLRSLESLGQGSPIPPWFPLLSPFEFRPFWTILSAHFLSFTRPLRFCSQCNLVHHTVVPASAHGHSRNRVFDRFCLGNGEHLPTVTAPSTSRWPCARSRWPRR